MADQLYRRPRLLVGTDLVDGFHCQSDEQTQWLRRHAHQASGSGTCRVFVVTPPDSAAVVAYYSWCMANIQIADAPPRLRLGAGRYPQPIALLARLAVHSNHQGKGLGAGLLADVIARTALVSEKIGCRGLLVHAEDENARNFYWHLIPEFSNSPTDPLHLVLLLKDIRKSLKD